MLSLRGQGLSFAAIAGRLGLRRSKDAYASFHRALASRSGAERAQLVEQELGRLQQLEARIRERDVANPDRMTRRLAALATMRSALG
ncbi:MAG: hypothetical protein M0T71_02050 [Actinomycetota bacterium]|nr:hypothetical protein [Actinomycetota bacterium]